MKPPTVASLTHNQPSSSLATDNHARADEAPASIRLRAEEAPASIRLRADEAPASVRLRADEAPASVRSRAVLADDTVDASKPQASQPVMRLGHSSTARRARLMTRVSLDMAALSLAAISTMLLRQ